MDQSEINLGMFLFFFFLTNLNLYCWIFIFYTCVPPFLFRKLRWSQKVDFRDILHNERYSYCFQTQFDFHETTYSSRICEETRCVHFCSIVFSEVVIDFNMMGQPSEVLKEHSEWVVLQLTFISYFYAIFTWFCKIGQR